MVARGLAGVDTVLFDMDGTLSCSMALAVEAAGAGLRAFYRESGEKGEIPTPEAVRALIGMPSADYFAALLPPPLRHRWADARRHVLALEIELLAAGKGGTFAGTEAVLAGLKKRGLKLGLVTNAGRGYFEATRAALNLDVFFATMMCIDDVPAGGTKGDLVRISAERLETRRGAIVGDKCYDIDAGRANGFATVGCTYGYGMAGELEGADAVIHDIRELPQALGL